MIVLLINKNNFNQIELNNVTSISYVDDAYVIAGVSYSKNDYNITILW